MKRKILLSIAQFEDIYSEWEDYSIKVIKEDRIAIYDANTNEVYDIVEAKELLTDFKGVLKRNNLMITSTGRTTAKIGLYIYTFESQYEELADQIERALSTKITKLFIYRNKGNRPHVRFEYAANITNLINSLEIRPEEDDEDLSENYDTDKFD